MTGRETLARSVPFLVDLEREPDNKVDADAVKVIISSDFKLTKLRGSQLGYLRSGYKDGKEKAAQLIGLMLDAGTIEVVKIWVTDIDAEHGNATMDCRFRGIPKPRTKAKKVTT
jgi:hypothetical protein